MAKQDILQMLYQANGDYVSGEMISRTLGISRAAVCKQVKSLRADGYEVEAVTNRGYRMTATPISLSEQALAAQLIGHPWAELVQYHSTITSTNSVLKQMAAEGAPHGSVLVASEQTQGRGRLGRSFDSPQGSGVYLSVLLRPQCSPEQLFSVTALTAVAVSDAIFNATGLKAGIKWPNDLVCGGKKLGGILTELSVEWETASTEYLVIGIGLNCMQEQSEFSPEIRDTACSINMMLGRKPDQNRLVAEMIRCISNTLLQPEGEHASDLATYRERCVTLGKQVRVIRAGRERYGTAIDIDDTFGLIVEFADGHTETISSGEVSVRGLYGYMD